MIEALSAILCIAVGFWLGIETTFAIVKRAMKDSQKGGEK